MTRSSAFFTVLVLDDEEFLRESLSDYFQGCGLEVRAFREAEAALEALKDKAFQLAIVDVRLPGMDGNHFIEAAWKISPKTHYIVHTGSMNYVLPNKLREIGLTNEDLFVKPVQNYHTMLEEHENWKRKAGK